MKKVIKGKVYDSSTAKKVAMRFTGLELDRTGWEELYQKKSGEHFLLRHRYSDRSEIITPVSYEEARKWAEEYLDAEEYEEIFGEVSENDTLVHLHISMSATNADKIRKSAAREGLTVSEYIARKCAE